MEDTAGGCETVFPWYYPNNSHYFYKTSKFIFL